MQAEIRLFYVSQTRRFLQRTELSQHPEIWLIILPNIIAVTSLKHWIHFLRSSLWPPTSNIWKLTLSIENRVSKIPCVSTRQRSMSCSVGVQLSSRRVRKTIVFHSCFFLENYENVLNFAKSSKTIWWIFKFSRIFKNFPRFSSRFLYVLNFLEFSRAF